MSSLTPKPPTRRQSMTSANNRSQRSMRPLIRRAKSNDMCGDAGSSRVLIDYSKTRATHDAKEGNRSQCRGPQMSRQLYDKGASPKKNISANNLDWNFLESTMDTSSELGSSRSRKYEKEEPTMAEKEEPEPEPTMVKTDRPELPRRTCSARLRVNLSRSTSGRRASISGAQEADEKMLTLWGDEMKGKMDVKGRTRVERSMSLGSHSLIFRRHPVRFHADLA